MSIIDIYMLGNIRSPKKLLVLMQTARAFIMPHTRGITHLYKKAKTPRGMCKLLLSTVMGILNAE